MNEAGRVATGRGGDYSKIGEPKPHLEGEPQLPFRNRNQEFRL